MWDAPLPTTSAGWRHARRNRAALAARFPGCFTPPNSATKRPLKLGIALDLVVVPVLDEAGKPIATRHLHIAIAVYCAGERYARALAAGGARYGLDGEPAGEVSEAHQAEATGRLEKIKRQKAARVESAGQSNEEMAIG